MFFYPAYGAGYIPIEKRNANTDERQAGQVLRLFFAIRSACLTAHASRARNYRLFSKNAARLISYREKPKKPKKPQNIKPAGRTVRLYFMAFFRALCSESISYTTRAAPLKIASKYRARGRAGQANRAGRADSLSRAASFCAWAWCSALRRGA